MDEQKQPVQQSRAAAWHPAVRALLIVTAVLLVCAAALFSLPADDCTTATTGERTTPAVAASAQPGTPGPGTTTGTGPGATTSKDTTTRTCARPGLTTVPVVALLLLAGLAVSPWLTKVTVGPVSAEIATNAPVNELAQEHEGPSRVVDPVAVGRARAAESFLQGVALPAGWSGATLLFLLAPPDPAVFARRAAPGAADLDDAALAAEAVRVAAVVAAAAEAPGQVAERAEDGRTDLAVAAVNAGKRVVAVVVATLSDAAQRPGASDVPGADADGPAPGPAVAGVLVEAARGWSRVVVDLLLLDDDTK